MMEPELEALIAAVVSVGNQAARLAALTAPGTVLHVAAFEAAEDLVAVEMALRRVELGPKFGRFGRIAMFENCGNRGF